MSLLNVAPEIVSAASGNLANLGSGLRSACAAAAGQTTGVVAPAADEVSAAITAALGTHAEQFQAVNAQAAAFHDQFVSLLSGGAAQYVSAEVANAQQIIAGAPGSAVAAANAADTVTDGFGGMNINYALGPFGVAFNAGPTFVSDGMGGFILTGLTGTGALTYSTPLGSGVLVSATVSEGFSPSGGWFGHILETWPLGSFVAVDGTGTFFPLGITSLAYNFNGLEFSVPGTGVLGPFVPNVTWNPNP
ncbi:hypothetical protein BST11_21350 [Mycobacterium alsense]|uniref:PE family protein n=1 Tax=Mycobacterium alsense TaxID=324058 RepID=A0AA42C2K5_9MYCO|nr:PE family protein [Mycobacterium alsense]MCV7381534.1 PE family protein [Mycobacterium alsense]OQZ88709.1 hypothetical protein BST11_21350 [Mycobacterium alsense]